MESNVDQSVALRLSSQTSESAELAERCAEVDACLLPQLDAAVFQSLVDVLVVVGLLARGRHTLRRPDCGWA